MINHRIISVLLCLLFIQFSYGQKLTLRVVDEENKPLEYASVLALNEKDSTMIEFGLTDRSGMVKLENQKPKSFLIQITFLGYETYWQKINEDNQIQDLGTIKMIKSSTALDVIEITDFINPVVFGKDTIQYNAAAFNIKPGDMVEDLLKKLPGVEAERDGTFKAMGEKVQNVLVNGKEFFGKDTRIATKNLDADAVEKVQVFDRTSDRSDFTGVDDGVRERSINLKLKKDRSIGSFGNTEAGYGSDNRFKIKSNLNKFTEKVRASLIGSANNINEENFSLSDYLGFMGGIGALLEGNGPASLGMLQNMGGLSGLGPQQGVKKIISGGLNLSSDLTSKTSLESSIFLNHLKHDLSINTLSENLTPGLTFNTFSKSDQTNSNVSGSYNLRTVTKIDSMKRFTFRSNGTYGTNNTMSNAFSQSIRAENIINQSEGNREVDGSNYSFNFDALYLQKLNNKGRNFSLNGVTTLTRNNDDGLLKAINNIYLPTSIVNNILQNQIGSNNGFSFRTQFTFTEPLTKKSYLEPKISFSNINNRTLSDFYDIINENPVLNQLLSAYFDRDYLQQNYGLSYLYNQSNFNLNLSSRYQHSVISGSTNLSEKPIRTPFSAILPSAYMRYQMGTSENLTFNYNANLTEPQLTQLQPAINNANPLAIYKGNPNLNAETNHRATLYYSKYEAFNQRMYSAQISGTYSYNKIINDLTFNESLVRITSPVNTPSEWTTNGKLEFESPFKPFKIKTKSAVRGAMNKGFASINNQRENVERWSYGYSFSVENRNKKVVDLLVGYRYNFSDSRLENTPSQNQTIKDQTIFSEFSLNLKDKVIFKSNFDYMVYQPSTEIKATAIPLWTMSISSFITKDKKLRATLSGYDLLNQNLGFITSSQLNFTNTTRFNVLTRYAMVSLSYNLKGHKKSGIEVIKTSI
jgi:hypothetical protein